MAILSAPMRRASPGVRSAIQGITDTARTRGCNAHPRGCDRRSKGAWMRVAPWPLSACTRTRPRRSGTAATRPTPPCPGGLTHSPPSNSRPYRARSPTCPPRSLHASVFSTASPAVPRASFSPAHARSNSRCATSAMGVCANVHRLRCPEAIAGAALACVTTPHAAERPPRVDVQHRAAEIVTEQPYPARQG